jgi:hypothetical protein
MNPNCGCGLLTVGCILFAFGVVVWQANPAIYADIYQAVADNDYSSAYINYLPETSSVRIQSQLPIESDTVIWSTDVSGYTIKIKLVNPITELKLGGSVDVIAEISGFGPRTIVDYGKVVEFKNTQGVVVASDDRSTETTFKIPESVAYDLEGDQLWMSPEVNGAIYHNLEGEEQ